jgi:hypothetical protein
VHVLVLLFLCSRLFRENERITIEPKFLGYLFTHLPNPFGGFIQVDLGLCLREWFRLVEPLINDLIQLYAFVPSNFFLREEERHFVIGNHRVLVSKLFLVVMWLDHLVTRYLFILVKHLSILRNSSGEHINLRLSMCGSLQSFSLQISDVLLSELRLVLFFLFEHLIYWI